MWTDGTESCNQPVMTDDTFIDLYVFWRYHDGSMQTVLGSRADRMYPDGSVRLCSYGGMRVKPVRILQVAAGKFLMGQIASVTEEANSQIKTLRDECRARIEALVAGEASR
jgi:hypothetical protein